MLFDPVGEQRETATQECLTRDRRSKSDVWNKPDRSRQADWLEDKTHPQPSKPYRRSKPKSKEIVATGDFRLTEEDGKCGMSTFSTKFILCREYLWVSKALSIPLSSITDIGQLDRCGYIRYWDSISRVEMKLCFNSPQMFSARRKAIEAFLVVVEDHLPQEDPAIDAGEPLRCEKCGSVECCEYVFQVFAAFGIILIASMSKLTPFRYVLCAKHARSRAISCSLRTALGGYFGFPWCFLAPCYVLKNLQELRREGICDSRTVILSLLGCVALPYALIATAIILFDWSFGSPGSVQN